MHFFLQTVAFELAIHLFWQCEHLVGVCQITWVPNCAWIHCIWRCQPAASRKYSTRIREANTHHMNGLENRKSAQALSAFCFSSLESLPLMIYFVEFFSVSAHFSMGWSIAGVGILWDRDLATETCDIESSHYNTFFQINTNFLLDVINRECYISKCERWRVLYRNWLLQQWCWAGWHVRLSMGMQGWRVTHRLSGI